MQDEDEPEDSVNEGRVGLWLPAVNVTLGSIRRVQGHMSFPEDRPELR